MWSHSRKTAANEDGISIIELTVAMSVFLVIVAAMLTLFNVVQRTTIRQDSRNQINNELRLAMDLMTKELRQATKIYSSSSASFVDFDTFSNGTPARVSFTASGTTLKRTTGSVTKTYISRLTSTSVFAYSPSITAPTDITITLRARPEHFQGDPAVVELTSQVRLRNKVTA